VLRIIKNVRVEVSDEFSELSVYQGEKQLFFQFQWNKKKLNDMLRKSLNTPQLIRPTERDSWTGQVITLSRHDYWIYEKTWYTSTQDFTPDEVLALIKSREIKRQQTLNRAKSLASSNTVALESIRGHIPSDLRLVIWAKYKGACANCGISSELQFDHVIPVALGGATSEENLQILCGPCNRRKGASLG
jgi:5-methylcytosine-specific restriction endonuclease McrA